MKLPPSMAAHATYFVFRTFFLMFVITVNIMIIDAAFFETAYRIQYVKDIILLSHIDLKEVCGQNVF